MDQETTDTNSPSPLATATEPPAHPEVAAGPLVEQTLLDVGALVERMIDAGQTPEPQLIEQIAAAGERAVEPLLEILRSQPRDWPAEAPLSHALGLLQVIRHPAAIPELIEIVKDYPHESGEEAAEALACYGEGVCNTLLELIADPALRGYPRIHAVNAARRAAGANPALRARFADGVRPILQNAIDRAERRRSDKPGVFEPSEDDFDLNIYDEISFLVNDLASIADPLARDLIQTVLDKDLFDPYSVDAKSVEQAYERGGDPVWTPSDWLAHYRESYDAHVAIMAPTTALAAQLRERARPTEPPRSTEPPPRQPLQPTTIRNKERNVGRNDPCWCGSGKKYKKCHMGKDTPA